MMNIKKPTTTIGVILFLVGIMITQEISAANILKVGTYSVDPNTEFTVQLEAENSNPFVAFQADIPIPAGFKYVEGTSLLNGSRISGHFLSASILTGNILRLIGYSVNNTPFLGTSGVLVSFKLKSGTIPSVYSLAIQNPLLGDSQTNNILTSSVNGQVTVLAPNISLSATVINYGRVPLGTSVNQTISLTNDGNRDLVINSLSFNDIQFTTTQATPFTIGANSSRSVEVRFSPSVKGSYAKQLQINSNDPDQPIATVTFNAIAFAVNEIHVVHLVGASSSTGKLDFTLNNMEAFTGLQFDINLPQPMTYIAGTAQLFRSADHTVSVNQVNPQTLRVLVFSVGNKSFTGTDGKILSMDFALKGVASWYYIGLSNVIIANSLGENIVSASYGEYLQITSPDIDAPTQLNFGDVSILSNSTKAHRIYNYGQEALTITQLMFNSDYFKSSQTLPVTIQPYQYLDLSVEFVKTIKGAATGTLKIVSNDPDENPFTIQLSGNAFTPNYLLINPQTFIQGESKNVAVEVENEEPFVAVQFDLSYPSGFTPDLNAVALTERKVDHGVAVTLLSANSLRILVYSMGQKSFLGKSGPILNIPFMASKDMVPGSYNLNFSNTLISNIKSENILYAARNGSLTIQKYSIKHDISLNTGWNIISANVVPGSLDLKALFQPLIDAGRLKKVMDESGKSLENFGVLGGWKNNIGNLNPAKGYKVNVTAPSTLSLEGVPVSLPMDLTLNTGWNIISFPSASTQDAMAMFQGLITSGKLKKVMDESGKSIENFGAFGGWKNNIGNLLPGKGYKVNVVSSCVLTIPTIGIKSAVIQPEAKGSDYFTPVFFGNGTDHMNIHLVDLLSSELRQGDQIGVFDGENCVGSATIELAQIMEGSISIAASADDQMQETANGFIEGHSIQLKLYREGKTYLLSLEKVSGNASFEKDGSLFAKVNTDNLTSILIPADNSQFKCYPNPFKKDITIEVQGLNEQEATVEIFNASGQRIKTLYKGSTQSNMIFKWNGTNDSGHRVIPGIYYCKVNSKTKQIILGGGDN